MNKNDFKQIPFLLDLLEDDSIEIQNHVLGKLASYGNDLGSILREFKPPLGEAQIRIALYLVDDWRTKDSGMIVNSDRDNLAFEKRLLIPGQIVVHKKYGYRGVIVDFDLSCIADSKWYNSLGEDAPQRTQPWYYLFVHMSNRVTYAAQSHLIPDCANNQVIHPLVQLFFVAFENGYYIRNTKPWPRMLNDGNLGSV